MARPDETFATAAPLMCGNDHDRPKRAVFRVTWPSGRFNPVAACLSCARNHIVPQAYDEGESALLEVVRMPDTPRGSAAASLFTWGQFTAASGRTLDWKIDCDALTLADWQTLARVVAPRIPLVREVVGIPRGGTTFANCLIGAGVLANEFDREGRPRLIVDDVWTTGGSVAKVYEPGDFVVVAFARGPVPTHVTAVWQLEEGFA